MRQEAARQREKAEAASSAELTLLTNDLRRQVIQRERQVEAQATRVKELRRRQKLQNLSQMGQLRRYERKHQQLEQKRCAEVQRITVELRRLRQMIGAVELQLATVGVAAPGCSSSIAGVAHRVANSAANADADGGLTQAQHDAKLMQHLRTKLRELDH